VKTELESDLISGEYINPFSGKKFHVKSKEWLQLKPWDYRILVSK
jgi:hypothetical protein